MTLQVWVTQLLNMRADNHRLRLDRSALPRRGRTVSKVPKTICLVRRKLFGSCVEAAAASLALPLAAARPATHITRAWPPQPNLLKILDSSALQWYFCNFGPSLRTLFVWKEAHHDTPNAPELPPTPELRCRVGPQHQDRTITTRIAHSS